ncbi:GNAT family N-acetyltransferase [Citreimonas salinaria]|uniref:Acetyltransferase (GNAT) family protein n=1 Tax=Citreimonas salinaria TaxID=321339 RepID=A0A1H3M3Y1_9RHOB|nr:GNAT family protein [Citreimonas salinaria]SDY71004.1 Acetyltransferase (GNAT) family protein [Citreimonas salinaria]
MTAVTLDASGLRLRSTDIADLTFVREAESAPENRAFVGQWTEAEHAACMDDADCRHLVIEDPRNGELLGYVVLQGLRDPSRAMLLRRLVVARKGRGAGPRAVEAVIRHCFDDCGLHRLWLEVREDNPAARRIYERFGFVTEGRQRESVKVGESYVDTLWMSMLENEYAARSRSASKIAPRWSDLR